MLSIQIDTNNNIKMSIFANHMKRNFPLCMVRQQLDLKNKSHPTPKNTKASFYEK